ncbi:MAG: hypothetical protein AAGC47_08795, partial [Bacteroidota bacterium]
HFCESVVRMRFIVFKYSECQSELVEDDRHPSILLEPQDDSRFHQAIFQSGWIRCVSLQF